MVLYGLANLGRSGQPNISKIVDEVVLVSEG